MTVSILHHHGRFGPKGKTTFIRLGKGFKSKAEAKKYAKKKLIGGSYRYVPSSKVKKSKHKSLFYVRR